jgi:rubredoxin
MSMGAPWEPWNPHYPLPATRSRWDNGGPYRTHEPMNEAVATATAIAYRTWMCVVCGFIYDEAAGLPEEGIAPGTRWEDIPDTWTCPDCGVTKDDFEMMLQ